MQHFKTDYKAYSTGEVYWGGCPEEETCYSLDAVLLIEPEG